LYDADDRLVICNSAYGELLYPGLGMPTPGTPFEALARNAVALGLVEEAKGRAEEWIAARLTKHRQPGEAHVQRRSDGRWIHINERKTTEGGTVAVYTNITAIKNAEEEIRAANSKLEQAHDLVTKRTRNWRCCPPNCRNICRPGLLINIRGLKRGQDRIEPGSKTWLRRAGQFMKSKTG
jgi:hypothetical protein